MIYAQVEFPLLIMPFPIRYNPGKKQPRKWENAMTLDKKSWGNRRDAAIEDFLTPKVYS